MTIVDFHTHAFPDSLAERAMPALEKEGNVKAILDGKISSLLRSMDEAGIHRSIVASIATKPSQFQPILKWSLEIASERIIPFPSVHPDDPDAVEHLKLIATSGLKGVKLHPYYQNFDLDAERLSPLYATIEDCGLVLLSHAGFDLAFPRDRKCDPVRIRRVMERFPRMKLVAAHLGSWEDWDEVERHLIGRPLYMDVSYSVDWAGRDRARHLILRHPPECMLFGTDSPWAGQRESLEQVRELELGAEREQLLLEGNAHRLLGIDPWSAVAARETKRPGDLTS